MAELTQEERLQPSLLDRLTDNDPEKKKESRSRRVLSVHKLRECVKRDLAWLLNTGNLSQTEDLDPYPYVAHSVLNYGITDLAGKLSSSLEASEIEQMLRQAIWDFEPRLMRETVKVRVLVTEGQMNQKALTFHIEGQLWAQPMPLRLYLKTQIDLETGQASITEDLG